MRMPALLACAGLLTGCSGPLAARPQGFEGMSPNLNFHFLTDWPGKHTVNAGTLSGYYVLKSPAAAWTKHLQELESDGKRPFGATIPGPVRFPIMNIAENVWAVNCLHEVDGRSRPDVIFACAYRPNVSLDDAEAGPKPLSLALATTGDGDLVGAFLGGSEPWLIRGTRRLQNGQQLNHTTAWVLRRSSATEPEVFVDLRGGERISYFTNPRLFLRRPLSESELRELAPLLLTFLRLSDPRSELTSQKKALDTVADPTHLKLPASPRAEATAHDCHVDELVGLGTHAAARALHALLQGK